MMAAFLGGAVRAEVHPFLAAEVERLEQRSLDEFHDPAKRARLQVEVLDMFGLSPMPERGDLRAVVTGRIEHEKVAVEKIHFQSSPGLYVTANLYLPRQITAPLPAILYVCGHSEVKTNGISFGNKAGYGHHGAWFARNGFACLVIDTLQLGEIPGLHHGTYREGRWWWNSRGYSPAAVEAWNGIRALDYLETRPEIDKSRLGVTGRSGGGAYSWSAIALDPRVKAAAPVAGITDLRNYVVDGAVEGHCDCMFFVNTHGWDYPMLAACAAPKPLLIVNTDQDSIFPLDGVVRLHQKVAGLYRLFGQPNNLGLVIGPGPHKDTQDLQIPVFRWFNRHLRGVEPLIDLPATNHFTPTQLRVFGELPADQRNTTVDEWFIPKAAPGPSIATSSEWGRQRQIWMAGLKEKVFRNWPASGAVEPSQFLKKTASGVFKMEDPRPIGALEKKAQTQLRRRFMLVGHTLDSVRVFDMAHALQTLREPGALIEAEGDSAVNLLFASIMAPHGAALRLRGLPASLRDGPDYLNVLRVLDLREALALAAERHSITLVGGTVDSSYAIETARQLGWNSTVRSGD